MKLLLTLVSVLTYATMLSNGGIGMVHASGMGFIFGGASTSNDNEYLTDYLTFRQQSRYDDAESSSNNDNTARKSFNYALKRQSAAAARDSLFSRSDVVGETHEQVDASGSSSSSNLDYFHEKISRHRHYFMSDAAAFNLLDVNKRGTLMSTNASLTSHASRNDTFLPGSSSADFYDLLDSVIMKFRLTSKIFICEYFFFVC
jgi:hypothetical protein